MIETEPVKIVQVKKPMLKEDEEETVIIDNYGKKIVETREKINLTREEFAKKINEKESLIKRVENEEMSPNDNLIEKIERFLNITLKVPYEMKKLETKPSRGKLTIGDVLEVK